MKKEFLLLSVLISSAILVFLIYPISNLTQLDEKNITKLDKKEKEELLIVIEEHKESPEGLAEEMRKLFGINNE